MKSKLKSLVGCLLMVFLTTGLTISTLHSHHELEWHHHHPEDYADTGNCLSPDTTPCPICGYLFNTNLPVDNSRGVTLYSSKELHLEDDIFPTLVFEVVNKGRSPPSIG